MKKVLKRIKITFFSTFVLENGEFLYKFLRKVARVPKIMGEKFFQSL